MDELIYAEIADRRESGPGEDVLSLLLSARHEDGSPMSDIELRDELEIDRLHAAAIELAARARNQRL